MIELAYGDILSMVGMSCGLGIMIGMSLLYAGIRWGGWTIRGSDD
jgi:hypothetical protein